MKKIDMHAHTTNRALQRTMEKYASIEVLLEKMKQFNIEKTVLLATYFPHTTSGVSNYRLLDWVKGREEFLVFGSLDFEHYYFQGFNELSELAESGRIAGVKIYTCYQNIDLRSDKFLNVVELAKKHSLPMMFHTGYSFSAMRTVGKHSIADMVKASDLEFVVRENPGMQFVFSHMSKPYFKDMISVAKRNDNLYTDMSGLISSRHDRAEIPSSVDNVREFLEKAGPAKMLFGTDFPVQTHEDSVYFVEEAMKGFKEMDKQEVYYGNARRLFGWQ